MREPYLSQLRKHERSQTRTGPTTQRMQQLKALKSITCLRLSPKDIDDGLYEFRAFRVEALGPVVPWRDEVIETIPFMMEIPKAHLHRRRP